MAVPAATTEPLQPPLRKKPLPAGRPREWYVSHNRRLKALRLAIALLDTGVYQPSSADNSSANGPKSLSVTRPRRLNVRAKPSRRKQFSSAGL